jgi:DNA ligase-1
MERLAAVCEAIAGTTRKTEKVRILADYFRTATVTDAIISAVVLSGRVFPAWEETTLQVGGSLLWRVILEVAGHREGALGSAYRKYGDIGAAAGEVLAESAALQHGKRVPRGLTLLELAKILREIAAARGPAAKGALLRELLTRATPIEAKYLIKFMTGELRIGLKESLVEESIAVAYGAALKDVQRANMLLGDIGETLRLAADHRLHQARMRLFHALGFMLASPVETAGEAFSFFAHAQIEDKYDGIRAQAHCSRGRVRLFSRTLDDITESFPELLEPLAAFPDDVILDGEVLAWNFIDKNRGHALPFSELQKRLGRKQVAPAMMRRVPVAYVIFDVLYARGELVLDRPLGERAAVLDAIFAEAARHARPGRSRVRTPDVQGRLAFEPAVVEEEPSGLTAVLRAPVLRADSPAHLDQLFARAQARGNEGLMIKDVSSVYTPGRRGRSWLKLKRELATLDVVVTAAEYGHGKRIGVLSDYTFAVRDPAAAAAKLQVPRTPSGDPLLNIGKAYSGLTDQEIAEFTQWFLAHTIADHGLRREVEPRLVLEVAFNAVMISDRHNSGYALRFPRILRIRRDKLPDQADTIDRVREIFAAQQLPKTA